MSMTAISAIEFSRWFLAAFFVFVAAFYTLRICLTTSRTGRSPVCPGRAGSRSFVIHQVFRIFRAAILLVCVARVVWPGIDAFLLPVAPLWRPEIVLAGNLLLLSSFLAVLYINAFMARDWRSGIDEDSGTPLITTGPFALSRNPMFILIQLAQLGLFLSLPSVFTLVCLVVGATALHAQVRLEERHLLARHGQAYRAYCQEVPRWLWPSPRGELSIRTNLLRPRRPSPARRDGGRAAVHRSPGR